MIGITKLYCGGASVGDVLRYGNTSSDMPANYLQFAVHKKPIVVWNTTKQCNLKCVHCYFDACAQKDKDEITTEEAKEMILDLAEFKAPVLLFSGGEPLMKKDIFELAKFAKEKGLRTVFSTNGTLIDAATAKKIKEVGISYVGISLDGIKENNDKFRGKKGAFELAMKGFQNCVAVSQKVGLRLTLTKRNYMDLDEIFDFIEEEKINRACFYHLVYSGRGTSLRKDDLTHEETRKAVDLIIKRTKDFHDRGLEKDILTVDNHTDGAYLYMRIKKEIPERAKDVLKLLTYNGGNSSGIGIACVDNLGNVHADQFWRHYTFGNIRKRKFSEIWEDTSDPLMKGLKNRKSLLKGKCGKCTFVNICNGNFRVRAEAVYNDVWQEDPACYLTEKEVTSITEEEKEILGSAKKSSEKKYAKSSS